MTASYNLINFYLDQGWNKSQISANLIVPKITAFISISGSVFIIQDVLRDTKKRNESPYHRVMVGLSIADIIFSFAWVLSSWPMPKGTQMFAIGSVATCDMVGFFHYLAAVSVQAYNCSLATYFFLQLKLNWTSSRMKNAEKWFHILPWSMGIILASCGLVVRAYGPAGVTCWLVSTFITYQGCGQSDSTEQYCGRKSALYLAFCILAINILAIAHIAIMMGMVYKHIVDIERQAEVYSFARFSSQKMNRMRSRRVMIQGILYASAIFFAHDVPLILLVSFSNGSVYFSVSMYRVVVTPLHGFINALIYSIPLIRGWIKKRTDIRKAENEGEERLSINQRLTSFLAMRWSTWTTYQGPGVSNMEQSLKSKEKDPMNSGKDNVEEVVSFSNHKVIANDLGKKSNVKEIDFNDGCISESQGEEAKEELQSRSFPESSPSQEGQLVSFEPNGDNDTDSDHGDDYLHFSSR